MISTTRILNSRINSIENKKMSKQGHCHGLTDDTELIHD